MLTFTAPQLTPSVAHLISFAFSALYVGSIYVSARARLSFNPNPTPHSQSPVKDQTTEILEGSSTASASSRGTTTTTSTTTGPREKMRNERWRDDPDVIKARLVAVCTATTTCCLVVYWILWTLASPISSTLNELFWDLIIRLGFLPSGVGGISQEDHSFPNHLWRSLRPHLITPVLFFGPLYATFLSQVLPGQKYWSWEVNVRREILSWQGIRNVIIAPPTEELVFRGCTLAVLHLAGVSRAQLVFLSPLSFGLAHVHHAWEVFNRYGRTSQAALRAITVTLFQLAYTTLFGCYTSYLFLRTSSIYPAITAHMFCNFMGFPRIGYEMQMFPRHKKWIIATYLIGVAGFASFLSSWTFTKDSFYWANYVDGRTGSVY